VSQTWKYLRPEDIRRLRNYEIGAKAMVEGYLAGRHRSKQRGSSIEFHEFRQYAPGDDLARIDWRVFARNDKLFLRTFEQETNLECHLLIDASASMGFRGDEARLDKFEYACFFAACLAWLVVSKNDRVSLTLFDQGIRRHLPAGSTRRHLHDVLRTLEDERPGAGTSLPETLRRAHPLLRRRGTLVLLSDFFHEPGELFRALNPFLHRGFRVLLFHLLDPAELDLGERGLSRFVDLESGERLTVHPQTVRQAWKAQMQHHSRALRRLAGPRGAAYRLIPTTESYFSLFDELR